MSRVLPKKFTLTIEENDVLGWTVTSDAHRGFMAVIFPEEGLPEGLRKVPASLRRILVAQMDADNATATSQRVHDDLKTQKDG